MTERRDPGGGGLTGATGDLTPDESDAPFVPGERREQSDAAQQGQVTAHQGAAAPAQLGELGEPGSETEDADPRQLAAERESGYGSQHGLAPNDPAYRMESKPVEDEARQGSTRREPRSGVDEMTDQEERF